jgi:hypothetical protein
VPPPGTTKIGVLLSKAKWVAIGIFAPEVVVYAAFLQVRCVFKFWRAMKAISRKDIMDRESLDPEKGSIQRIPSIPVSVNEAVHGIDGIDLQRISDMSLEHETNKSSEIKPTIEGKNVGTNVSASSTGFSIPTTQIQDDSIDEARVEEAVRVAQDTNTTYSSAACKLELDEFRIRREEMVGLLFSLFPAATAVFLLVRLLIDSR